eukprot:13096171-Alexandrium_andersonii.AAC.1
MYRQARPAGLLISPYPSHSNRVPGEHPGDPPGGPSCDRQPPLPLVRVDVYLRPEGNRRALIGTP